MARERITTDPNRMRGLPCVRDTRVTVSAVLGQLAAGQSIEQILEMQEAGISFGSHSFSHRDLTTLDVNACVRDLRASKDVLENVLGREVPFVAYPRGRHNRVVRRAAERAGFTHGFGLPEGREPKGRYSIPRIGVYEGNDVRALRMKTSRLYLPLRMSRGYPWLRKVAGKPPRTPPAL
jgi:peptidoglycan/xylan/chitin deacetylase (PgdA/CDA1 family)